MWLTRFSLRQPIIIALFFLAICISGLMGYLSMGKNIMPNVTFPMVTVMVSYPGAGPAEIERLILRPLEDQIQTLRHLDKINATAVSGSGVVLVRFKLGSDVDVGANDVSQAINAARSMLPSDLDPPEVRKLDVGSQPILTEAVTSKTRTAIEVSRLVTDEIEPEFTSVPGIGNVQVSGDYPRQFRVEPSAARLLPMGLTLLDVVSAVSQGNIHLPGGRLDQPGRESTVGVSADTSDPLSIANLPLNVPLLTGVAGSGPSQVHIGDVATVVDGYADHRLISTMNNSDAILVEVSRDLHGDTISAISALRKKIVELHKRFPDLDFREIGSDYEFTLESINGVLSNLAEGIVLTALVLMLFLHVWRSALVVMLAIPTSVLATFMISWLLGFTIDVLSLMGLSLTIGILVDDSIVVLENIMRHFELGHGADEAALLGRSEIGGAAIAITLVDVVVFLPIALMQGIIGEYMKEFGVVVVCATLFSLLVSFTLTPLLAARWALVAPKLSSSRPNAYHRTVDAISQWFDALKDRYHHKWLPFSLRRPWMVIGGSFFLVLCALGLLLVPNFGGPTIIPGEFQPYTEYGEAVITVEYQAGTPIMVTQRGVQRLVHSFLNMKGVQSVVATVGRGSNGFSDVIGGQMAEIRVYLKSRERHEEHKVIAAARHLGAVVPGAKISAVGAQNAGAPPITYTITGPAEEQESFAKTLSLAIAKVPNAQDVKSSLTNAGPRLEILIDPVQAAMLGVSPSDAANTARAAIGGVLATKVRTSDTIINTIVRLPENSRNDLETVADLRVRSANGATLVPLSRIAHFQWMREPTVLEHQDRHRIVRVYADTLNGAPIGAIVRTIDQQLKKPGFIPAGLSVSTLADSDAGLFGDAMTKLALALLTSVVLIYMLLVILYRTFITPFVILFSVPVAGVGAFGLLALFNGCHILFPEVRIFQAQTLNLFSMLGIVMLAGLVAKNGILLVDYANILLQRGTSVYEAILQSATLRFRPIIMTTITMIAGMMPLALGLTEGAEFRKSMGTVIIGGLLSSLFLTMFLVPAVYLIIMAKRSVAPTPSLPG